MRCICHSIRASCAYSSRPEETLSSTRSAGCCRLKNIGCSLHITHWCSGHLRYRRLGLCKPLSSSISYGK
ncbi:TPA: hypothetical protein N0F65_012936 [Lagenidium giganteum]|uniref:Uncharacterized protein n=1 Tax=Lagenidium giganteum TaxID=4803 RepID=A0AAV2Z3R1_9STRA|nr:TPA: hypothetical protein N0F65_012936 [Lagenidium giganteum]